MESGDKIVEIKEKIVKPFSYYMFVFEKAQRIKLERDPLYGDDWVFVKEDVHLNAAEYKILRPGEPIILKRSLTTS